MSVQFRFLRAPALVLALGLSVLLAACGDREAVLVKASKPEFNLPHNMVFTPDGRHILLADQENHVIRILDPDTLEILSNLGKGILREPRDVAIGPFGHLLIADSGNNRVVKYQLNGLFGQQVGELTQSLVKPEGVATGPNKAIYAISVTTGVITVFDAKGKVINARGGNGTGPLRFHNPHGARFGPDGLLYIADGDNSRIQVLDRELNFVKVIGGAPWNFNRLRYLAIDGGLMYVADKFSSRLLVLDMEDDFEIVTILPVDHPEGVVARGNRFWVSETGTGRVLMYEWR